MNPVICSACLPLLLLSPASASAEEPTVAFEKRNGALEITIGEKPFAAYVWEDEQIPRPGLRHVHSPSGLQVTRNQPPVPGKDLDDHPTFHPGIWMAFGDLSGADFWRNQARVRHVEFTSQPKGAAGRGAFAVRSSYETGEKAICTEHCRIDILVRPAGTLLIWNSEFTSADHDVSFGDQEEMGLGVRLATPLAVVNGGEIRDSEGRRNESQVWGKKADWCEYSGTLGGRRAGVVLMPDPNNFRRAWFHARDYGLLVANPFGRNAFTGQEKSTITVKRGESLRLRFGLLIWDAEKGARPDPAAAYKDFLDQLADEQP